MGGFQFSYSHFTRAVDACVVLEFVTIAWKKSVKAHPAHAVKGTIPIAEAFIHIVIHFLPDEFLFKSNSCWCISLGWQAFWSFSIQRSTTDNHAKATTKNGKQSCKYHFILFYSNLKTLLVGLNQIKLLYFIYIVFANC